MAFARAVNTMGLSLVMSFLGIYVVHTRHYPAWLYGIVLAAANLCQSWSNAWAGNLSDRIGRRPLITRALLVRAVFIAGLGTQVMLDAPLWTLALNIVISSALRGCFEPVAYALVSDVVTDEQRIPAFGLQRMGTNLGWAIGPALGGVLTLVMPYGAVFYVAATAMIVAAIVTMRVVDPVRARAAPSAGDGDLRASLADAWADPLVKMLLAGTFLCALLETQMFSTMSVYLTDVIGLEKHDVGLLYTVNGIGVLCLQLPALALLKRWGIAATLPWASIVDALGFALIGVATGMPGAVVAMVTLTCAEVMFDPAHQTAIAEVADPARRGRTFGVIGFAQTVGIALAPLCGGILLDIFGATSPAGHVTMWVLIACFGLGQAACFAIFVRRRRAITPAPALRVA
jgi:MFS family permease